MGAVTSAHLSIGFYFLTGQHLSLCSPLRTPSIPPVPNSVALFLLLRACPVFIIWPGRFLYICSTCTRKLSAASAPAKVQAEALGLLSAHTSGSSGSPFNPTLHGDNSQIASLARHGSFGSMFPSAYYTFSHPSPAIPSVSNAQSYLLFPWYLLLVST